MDEALDDVVKRLNWKGRPTSFQDCLSRVRNCWPGSDDSTRNVWAEEATPEMADEERMTRLRMAEEARERLNEVREARRTAFGC